MKKIIVFFLLSGWNSFSQTELVTNTVIAGVKVNNKIVFMGNSPNFGKELWVSDGTAAGTNILRDINVGSGDSTPHLLTLLDDVVYFRANSHDIWRTDGTSGGTYYMTNNNLIISPTNFVKTQNFIFFISNSRLWRMNTNPNSENLVTISSNLVDVKGLIVLDYNSDVIMFNAKTNIGWAIWRSNGGVSLMVKDLYTLNLDVLQMNAARKIGSEIYFSGFSTDFGGEPWKTDGTLTNTVMIKDIMVDANYFNSPGASQFTKVGSKVFFVARDNFHGYELWVTDGTASGTNMVKEIYPGNNNGFSPGFLLERDGLLYFTAFDVSGVVNIWKSDGTSSGTIKVTTNPDNNVLGPLTKINNIIYFSMHSPTHGNEPCKMDLNNVITMIQDLIPGTQGSDSNFFYELNNETYFIANNNISLSGQATYKIVNNILSNADSDFNALTSIFPNPTNGIINLQIKNILDFQIEIFDIIGKKVGQFKNQNQVDISNYNSGIYSMKITDLITNSQSTQKIIKQ